MSFCFICLFNCLTDVLKERKFVFAKILKSKTFELLLKRKSFYRLHIIKLLRVTLSDLSKRGLLASLSKRGLLYHSSEVSLTCMYMKTYLNMKGCAKGLPLFEQKAKGKSKMAYYSICLERSSIRQKPKRG